MPNLRQILGKVQPARLLRWQGWRGPWPVLAGALAAALVGDGVVGWATQRWGPGANSDGLTYLVLARSLFAGAGYGLPSAQGGVKPMTHFPPGYPSAIAALMGLTQGDEARAALWVGWLSLAVLVFLAAWLTYRATGRAAPAVGVASWLAVGYGLLRLYPYVFSEALFLPSLLVVAWLMARWQARPGYARAVAVGLALAWLVAVRWVGLMAFAWVAWDTYWAWRSRPLRETGPQMAVALGSGALPVALWVARNRRLAGSATNRPLAWHPPTPEKWTQAWETWRGWVEPLVYKWGDPSTVAGPLAALALGALLWAWWRVRREDASPCWPWMRRWAGFALWYALALSGSLTLVDAASPLDYRLLSPLYLALTLLLALALARLLRGQPLLGAVLAVGWVAALWWGLKYDKRAFMPLHLHGEWLRKARWQQAEIWGAVRRLPPEAVILTNEYPETLYYTRRPAHALLIPQVRGHRVYFYNEVTAEYQPTAYPSLEAWAQDLGRPWAGRCVAVVWVTLAEGSAQTQMENLLEVLLQVLTPVYRADSGAILALPGQEACLSP